VPDGKRRWFDRKQEHAEQTIEEGDQGIAEQKPQAKLIPGRPLVKRLAAKRHHDPGKSGQRHRDLGGRRQGFTWLHRCGLDRIQPARTNTNYAREKTNATLISFPMRCHLVVCGNGEPDAIDYAKFYSRSHDAVIRVYDDAGNVIETHEHAGRFQRVLSFCLCYAAVPA